MESIKEFLKTSLNKNLSEEIIRLKKKIKELAKKQFELIISSDFESIISNSESYKAYEKEIISLSNKIRCLQRQQKNI